jgi:hypothetical protein
VEYLEFPPSHTYGGSIPLALDEESLAALHCHGVTTKVVDRRGELNGIAEARE